MTATGKVIVCIIASSIIAASARPTIYMKNINDNLEPYLLPLSSTVIPIPMYQVSSSLVARRSRHQMSKKLTGLMKPDGPSQLITVSGLKKMAADEKIKPH